MINYYSIRHNIPGRLRIRLPKANYNEAWLAHIQLTLNNLSSIIFVRINPRCNGIIINYQSDWLSYTDILKHINICVHNLIEKSQAKVSLVEQKTNTQCSCHISSKQKNLVRPALIRFTGISCIMGGVFIKTRLFGLTVSQTLFSPLGIAAIIVTLPLFKESCTQFKEKRIALEGFLGAGCVAAVAASEALTAFEILWINAGAELLTTWITERSRKSISKILDVTSHHTFKLVKGVEVETKVSDLQEGDIVVLHTGEKVCIDGEIIDGQALIDESPITGRADFMPRSIGDTVLAGTFVRQGLIYVCANKVGDKTYLSRILCLVEDSLANKAPIEGLADKLAKKMVMLGFISTGATFLITGSLWRAFTVMLVMACPCATVLSASTAVSASMNAAARKNILIKGGRYIEDVGKADCICFDKTGTLTSSDPRLVKIVLLKQNNEYVYSTNSTKNILESKNTLNPNITDAENALLQLVVSTEMHNHHPIAQAIKMEAHNRNIQSVAHTCCEYFLGMGMIATINGSEIIVGNRKLMDLRNVAMKIENKSISTKVSNLRRKGNTVLFVARDNELIALLAFDNPIRPESKQVINILKNNGVTSSYLITGDEKNTAQSLSSELGINKFYASIMPQEKAEIVKELQKKHAYVLMVGDGINDALALTQSDIGIAMGAGGSEVAVEAADITLVNDNLYGIVYVHSLSKKTVKIVHQNFWIATGSNLVGLVLGALGIMPPVMAGMLHIIHTVGVLANSSRLLRFELKTLEQDNYIYAHFNPNYSLDYRENNGEAYSENYNEHYDDYLLSDKIESVIDIKTIENTEIINK